MPGIRAVIVDLDGTMVDTLGDFDVALNLTLKDLPVQPAPPVMPWREFADWIRMSQSHDIVWGWIRHGYIPSHKVGKHVVVNVALLTSQLLEQEWTL